ncbi:MAG: glycosyltransferase family 39 protein [Chloroflexi bacterium]|nr:glycosyltransferase family 39 protein [Chloroflexota bacterium]
MSSRGEERLSAKGAIDVKRWQRADTVFAVVVGLVTVLSRLPFRAAMLSNHDAVNYALALEHFDMRLHQPHPPGYILYILLGRAFNLIFHDHLTALVWFSIVFSGLAVVAVYLAGREAFSQRVGAIAALLLATSPAFWLRGEMAAPYTADLFASAIMGWFCYRVLITSGQGLVFVTALVLGLIGAFRPQTLVFLFPLFLYALRQRPWKTVVGAVVLAGVVFGAFFLFSVIASGGLAAFVLSMRITIPIFWSKETMARSATLPRYVKNVQMILRYIFRVTGEWIAALAFLGYVTRSNCLQFWRNPKLRFLAIWILPTWIVYTLIWPGNLGTAFIYMTPAFLLAALGLDWIAKRSGYGIIAGGVVFASILIWNVVVFTSFSSHPLGERYRYFDSYESIVSSDEYYRGKLALLSDLPVEGTIVYANAFRHLQYYLPAYRTFSYPSLRRSDPSTVKAVVSIENGLMENWAGIETAMLVPPDTERIVFFDLPLGLVDATQIEERAQSGYAIYVISVPLDHEARWTSKGLSVSVYE